jgi:hypothetical protein
MSDLFRIFEDLRANSGLSPRVKTLLYNLVKLRADGWPQLFSKSLKPVKISEIHDQKQKEIEDTQKVVEEYYANRSHYH